MMPRRIIDADTLQASREDAIRNPKKQTPIIIAGSGNTKYTLTKSEAERLDVIARYKCGLLGFDASNVSATQVFVESGKLTVIADPKPEGEVA